jgi:NAD(P)H-quinone oxidoreductase subunit 5
MGFMIMQAGLGFFGAALTHLVLHGFYKAYQFLSSGERIEQTSPTAESETRSLGVGGLLTTALTALAGGAVFAGLTGKGTALDTGLLLTALVVLTTLHATREVVTRTGLSAAVRYGGVPLVFLPAIAVYALAYRLVTQLLTGLPVVTVATELTPVHGAVAAAFLVAYLAIESGLYRQSPRLYVALLNVTQPPSKTVLTSTEEYNEY